MMDILIFGGQSNMQGQSEALIHTEPVPGAFEYRFLEDRIVPLRNPAGENIRYDRTPGYSFEKHRDAALWLREHVAGGPCFGNTNLVSALCRAYIAQTGRSVLAVHIAKGSTTLSQWLPGTEGYGILTEKGSAARKAAGEAAGRCFFLWLQGESDAIAGNTAPCYKSQLAELMDGLKRDLGVEQFGIIRVGRFTMDDRDWEIIRAQDEICEENPDFLMLTRLATQLIEQKEAMSPDYHGHYSAAGLEMLGEDAGTALGKYVKGTV